MREKRKSGQKKFPPFLPLLSLCRPQTTERNNETREVEDVVLVGRVTWTDKANNDEEKSKETLGSLVSGPQRHQPFTVLPPTLQRSCPQPRHDLWSLYPPCPRPSPSSLVLHASCKPEGQGRSCSTALQKTEGCEEEEGKDEKDEPTKRDKEGSSCPLRVGHSNPGATTLLAQRLIARLTSTPTRKRSTYFSRCRRPSEARDVP